MLCAGGGGEFGRAHRQSEKRVVIFRHRGRFGETLMRLGEHAEIFLARLTNRMIQENEENRDTANEEAHELNHGEPISGLAYFASVDLRASEAIVCGRYCKVEIPRE